VLIENSGKDGFLIQDPKAKLLWWKYLAFEKGISTREFHECELKDIKEVIAIKTGIEQKKKRNKSVQDLMNRARF